MPRFWQGTGLYVSAGKRHECGRRCEQRARVSFARGAVTSQASPFAA